jgi:hypothetical protein
MRRRQRASGKISKETFYHEKEARMTEKNRYEEIIEAIFRAHYVKGEEQFDFDREEIERQAKALNIMLPKNLGDLIYTFRHRNQLPESIGRTAGKGKEWVIRQAGRSRYRFALVSAAPIAPRLHASVTKIPDATPGLIAMYAFSDEQALLAKVRYNRLLDIFCRVAAYSLQSHLRTTVPNLGQVETDEIYVGIHRSGAHYVFPVQAKGGKDKLSFLQIEQDLALCRHKFPRLICRPIGAQFLAHDIIVLFEFREIEGMPKIVSEEHYRLVPPEQVTPDDLKTYAALVGND